MTMNRPTHFRVFGPQLMKELLDVFQTGSFCANG